MRILYLDNFRGFRDTFLPLKDVNFFVGENSTGKTSVLSLINLLSSPNFWMDQEFNNQEIQLGGYDDIADRKYKDFFVVGFSRITNKRIYAIILKFKNNKNVPLISELKYAYDNKYVCIKFEKSSIVYSYQQLNKDELQHNTEEKLRKLLRDKLICSEEHKKEKINSRIYRSIAIVKNIIDNKIELSRKNSSTTADEFMIIPLYYGMPWIAPIRTKPQKTYDGGYTIDFSPEGEHIPFLLRQLYKNNVSKKESLIKSAIEKYGTESGMFESFKIKSFGKDSNVPFEIQVFINHCAYRITNVGYGVSQILPVLVESIVRNKKYCIAIQQPEVHLHPRAQAALGELFFDQNLIGEKEFIIETHSDFIIDRFRLRQKRSEKKSNAQVVFFEKCDYGNKLQTIAIEDDGNYHEDQPESFRSFFLEESLDILEI